MKTCTKCKLELSYSEFYRLSRSKDGYQNACKQCVSTGSRLRPSLTDSLSPEDRRHVFTQALIRMRDSGIMSEKTFRESLERVEVL